MLKKIVCLAIPGTAPFEFGVICEVFGIDRGDSGGPTFEFAVATADPGPVEMSLGFSLNIETGLDVAADADLIAVPAHHRGRVDERYLDVIRAAEARGAWVLSVCSGAFVLAAAGLLDGRRATTHWKFGRELAARHPRVRVEQEPLWVKDGNIYTCAGISAGIDLALAWVEEDCGASLAHEAARELVLFLRRPGGQPQLSVSLASQASEMASIRELQIWIAEHLGTRLSVEDLASRMAMSVRNFERVFTREVGTTPSQYVMQARVEAARRLLERTYGGLKHVAAASGFGSIDVMRRAFVRLLGTTPRRYRELAAAPALSERSESKGRE